MWDIFLVIVAFLFGIIGLLGSFIPVLPGPPFTYIGLLFMHWTRFAEYSTNFLLTFLFLTFLITFVDNILPAWMTKKFGGSRYAVWGAFLGLIVGLFFPPLGVLVGSFASAFAGELLLSRKPLGRALKIGMASFAAFIIGTGAKFTLSLVMLIFMIAALG